MPSTSTRSFGEPDWEAYFFTDPDYVEYGAYWWPSYSYWLVIPEID